MNAGVLVLILGGSAFITHWFANNMYIRCAACGTLNAKRRLTNCPIGAHSVTSVETTYLLLKICLKPTSGGSANVFYKVDT
jgi:hypothetical protein